jgi:hypothetical protein
MMRQPSPPGVGAAKRLHACWRTSANCAVPRSPSKGTTAARLPISRPKRETSPRAGSAGWWLASGKRWWCVDPAMSVGKTDTTMGPPFDVQVTGEPRETETVRRGSERGRWQSTHQGNSLASYSTARPVRRGGVGKHSSAVRPAPTLLYRWLLNVGNCSVATRKPPRALCCCPWGDPYFITRVIGRSH